AYGTLNSYISNGTTLVPSGSVATGQGNSSVTNGTRFLTMDVNGDGKTDYLVRDPYGTWYVWLSNGTTFTQSGSVAAGQGNTDESATSQRFFPMDINGDGRMDLVVRDAYGTLNSYISNGATLVYSSSSATGQGDSSVTNGTRFLTMDVNGDGKMDYLVRDPYGTWYVWQSSGL